MLIDFFFLMYYSLHLFKIFLDCFFDPVKNIFICNFIITIIFCNKVPFVNIELSMNNNFKAFINLR